VVSSAAGTPPTDPADPEQAASPQAGAGADGNKYGRRIASAILGGETKDRHRILTTSRLEEEVMDGTINRRTMILGTAATAAVVCAPHIARAARPITLRVSSSAPPDKFGAHYLWYKPFEEEVARLAGDRINLQYFPNAQLGKEADVVNQVKAGSVDMMLTGSSIWATIVPEFGMLDLGFLFNSYDHCAKALDTGVGDFYNKLLLERSGVTILGWTFQVGARSVYTTKPVASVKDLHGVKLRVLPTKAFIDTFDIIGATPTPIPINELYMAVQTGVVDGFEHDPGTAIAYKLYEVTKYCFLTNHVYTPLLAYIGKAGLAKMPADLRPLFLQAAAHATTVSRAEVKTTEAEAVADLKGKGITFTEAPPAEIKELKQKMAEKLYSAYLKQYPITEPLFAKIKEAEG
jgi:tripartite ATP-independent transporter DctP family solute receptor